MFRKENGEIVVECMTTTCDTRKMKNLKKKQFVPLLYQPRSRDARPMADALSVVKIKVGTLCIPGQVCLLLSRYSLVLACVEDHQLYSFFTPFVHEETESQARASLRKPLVFWFSITIRLPSTTNTISILELR